MRVKERKKERQWRKNIEGSRRNQAAQRALCQCTQDLESKSGLWPFALIENATLQEMELCFVLRADIKEGTLLLFGMRGLKVGTQSLSPRNSDGICNASPSVSYCVGPNGPRHTMTGEPKLQAGLQACRQINGHARGGKAALKCIPSFFSISLHFRLLWQI